MYLCQIGTRIVNLERLSSANYYPAIEGEPLLNVFFDEQNSEQFKGNEAEVLWTVISANSQVVPLKVTEDTAADEAEALTQQAAEEGEKAASGFDDIPF